MDCSADISRRSRKALRCEPCSTIRETIRNRQRAEAHYWENRTEKLQYMKRRRQTPEYKQVNREWIEKNPNKVRERHERAKQKRRDKTGYNPEGRTCENCHADISDRGHRAKRCVSCSAPPARTCIVCGADISFRGRRAIYCNEQCRLSDHLTKESTGYTKICTKCNEEKEQTEFGLHYNLRRSVCKDCEANAARVYAGALPVQERQRRRRIQGESERIKKANLPPEQKAMLKTKAREALIRNRFGDFDEYAQYLKRDGKCAICGIAKPFKRDTTASECLELDHDHKTGRPRGFLCKNCNLKLLSCYDEKFPSQHQDSPHLNAYLKRG